ncbi:universal stress protein [uncultured Desulfosarcina sp.]|uniref:universal stress protein n=1 Tax=uncultured Desulfosarcina sp. TaxID=218289 RepID=UPI0029C6DC46|nr:universal stress protein [uncultured Desulfosarcina sp.]
MPLTIQAIVCAVDFSSFSPLVVGYGKVLARRAGVRLYLFHAVHNPQDGAHPTAVFERGGDLAHLTDDARQRIQALMTDADVDWEPMVRFGEPVEQTAAFVDSLPPSLVVSASHGVSGFRRFFIGTVVERLTRALKRPMLVVKPGDGEAPDRFNGFRSAVVSCDSHGHWQRTAPLLPLLQTDTASRIHMVHAMEGPMEKVMTDSDAASYGQVQQALQDRLNRQLNEQGRRMFPHADQLSVTIAPGVPQEMVLQIADEQASDIIVVGVRCSGRVSRWISGSTTETLLRRSPCCVLTVPEPVEPIKTGGHRR